MQNITQPKKFPPHEMCEQCAEKQPAPFALLPGVRKVSFMLSS